MKFADLLKRQDEPRVQELMRTYEDDNGYGYRYSDDRRVLDLSAARIRKAFKRLPAALAVRYRQVVAESYLLTPVEFKQVFGNRGELVQGLGLYLWHPGQELFIPPAEVVAALLPANSLLLALLKCSQADLRYCFDPKHARPKIKSLLIKELNQEMRERFSPARIQGATWDRWVALLAPVQPVIDRPYGPSLSFWNSYLKQQGSYKNPKNQWAWAQDADEYLRALQPFLAPLFEEQLCLIQSSSQEYGFRLVLNPLIKDELDRRSRQAAQENFQRELAALQPLSVAAAGIKSHQIYHTDDQRLLFMLLVTLAWRETERLDFTQNGGLRRSSVKKLAQRWATVAAEVELYESVVEILSYSLSAAVARLGWDRPRSDHSLETLVGGSAEEFLAAVRAEPKGELDKFFSAFLNEIPVGEWLPVAAAKALFSSFCFAREPNWREHSESGDFFSCLVSWAYVLGGQIDLLFDQVAGRAKFTFENLRALRRVAERQPLAATAGGGRLRMQANLEIPVLPDAPSRVIFAAASIFDVAGPNLFTLNEETLRRLPGTYPSQTELMKAIAGVIEGELPQAALKLIGRVYGERQQVFLVGQTIYLYNPDSLAQLQRLIGSENISQVVDNRLIVLHASGRRRQLAEKLKRNNVAVDTPTTVGWEYDW